MSDLPELIVDGDDAEWMLCDHDDCKHPPHTVRIDGPLPNLAYNYRPIRAGDRVTLASIYGNHPHPFATATVAKIEYDEPPQEYEGTVDPVWLVTVTAVEVGC